MTLLKSLVSIAVPLFVAAAVAGADEPLARSATPWISDLGDGRYKNPVIYADYSDPDVVRVGDDYYLTSSSFSHVPGLPILHSRDLINWALVGHALPRLTPGDHFSVPRHGEGVWAPSLRHHAGLFYLCWGDPDFGLFMITAKDVRGPWTAPAVIKSGRGLIDPCPFWDDDGQAYLIHGWARSRSGISNQLTLHRLSPDGTRLLDEGFVVIDANKIPNWRTLEGPKLYKRDGYYYVFAPAGGVKTGWQAVFRSKSITGPYEHRIVLEQGTTRINGPHQGAWVNTPFGQDWFLHFQDREAYGRILHLQPVVWKGGWPVMGNDPEGDGHGESVLVHKKPDLPAQPISAPVTSDEFEAETWNLAWQWQANPQPAWAHVAEGALHLRCVPTPLNLYGAPNLLMQKFPAPWFDVVTKVSFASEIPDERAGLVVFGDRYAWVGVRTRDGRVHVSQSLREDASRDGPEAIDDLAVLEPGQPVWLRLRVRDDALCEFSYSLDGENFQVAFQRFSAVPARWVGAKFGLFAAGPDRTGGQPEPALRKGLARFEWFRVTAP